MRRMKKDFALAVITSIGAFLTIITASSLAFSWTETGFIVGMVMMAVGITNFGRGIICEDECED